MEQLFGIAAGISTGRISLLIDVIIAVLMLLWTTWIIYRQFSLLSERQIDIYQLMKNSLFALILTTVVIVFVIAF